MQIPVKETKYRLTVFGDATNETINDMDFWGAVNHVTSRFQHLRREMRRDSQGNPVTAVLDGDKLAALIELQQNLLTA